MSEVIAILCSDIHLSHRPPLMRSAEPDWYAAMGRQLLELDNLRERHRVPVIVAGDLFDKWNSPPELINFAMTGLFRDCWTIPGQHDLPYHRLDLIHKSAYWTLDQSGTITHIKNHKRIGERLAIYAFPWGVDVQPLKIGDGAVVNLAVVHHMIYREKPFPDASESDLLSSWKDRLAGYDAAVFGDNHAGFLGRAGNCNVFNAGTFFRRTAKDRDYRPMVGLLKSDGTIEPYYMDVSRDVFLDEAVTPEETRIPELDASELVEELVNLGTDPSDFEAALRRAANDLSDGARRMVLEALEHGGAR